MIDYFIDGRILAGWLQRRRASANLAGSVPRRLQKIFLSHRLRFILLCKTFALVCSLLAAFLLRFDLTIPESEERRLLFGLVIALVIKTVVFYMFGIERGWWRFAGIADLAK